MADADLDPLLHRLPQAELTAIYNRHKVKPEDGPTALARKIRLDGSNSIANLARGIEGTPYADVVWIVVRQLNVKVDKKLPVVEHEYAVLAHCAEQYWEGLSEEERADLARAVGLVDPKITAEGLLAALKGGGGVAMLALRPLVVQIVTRAVVAVLVKLGAKEAAKNVARAAGYAVPGVNIALFLWTLNDIASPAMRKTVPTVIELALLRLQHPEVT